MTALLNRTNGKAIKPKLNCYNTNIIKFAILCSYCSWHSIVGVMIRLRTILKNCGSTPKWRTGFPQCEVASQDIKLTTHFHLLLWLKRSGIIPPLPHIPSWCAEKLYYFYTIFILGHILNIWIYAINLQMHINCVVFTLASHMH